MVSFTSNFLKSSSIVNCAPDVTYLDKGRSFVCVYNGISRLRTGDLNSLSSTSVFSSQMTITDAGFTAD